MEANSQKLENVRTTILSLLLARKGGSTLRQLDNDYCEVEGTHVPWKDFGYISLLNFLQSMKKNVQIEHINNTIILKGIATDKSKHVSRLVAGQKSQAHMVGRKVFKPSHYYPRTAPPKVPIPADILLNVIGLINNHPEGVNKDYIFQKVQSHMPFVSIQMQDMEEQFRELSHKIFFKNNKIYPVESKSKTFDYSEKVNGLSSSNDGQDQRSPVVTAGGEEDSDDLLDYDDDDDEFAFTPRLSNMKATTKPTSNFIKETVSKYQDQITEATSNVQYEHNSSHYLGDQDFNNDDQFHMKCNNDTKENRRDSWEGEILINERVKFRLEKLIQNRPNGIWCAELPELYLEEYKVSLNYTELGFNSVREFASQLPEIFYCMQPHGTGDFMLYYAKKEIPSNKIKETYKSNTLAQLHQIYEPKEEDALPVTVSLDICKELIPDNTMNIGECVGYLSVENLAQSEKPYIEVLVVEVFTPSFFWIQLRQKQKTFKKFMDDLHNFYVMKRKDYVIPPLVLEKGLNCACVYNGVWHRGIIKTVKPDLQVTVMFYDYGTLKTYPSEEIHYLHRMFSYLPAQAIPCGLVNTRPYKVSKWTRSATHHFAIRTQIPLIATIASINAEDNSMMVTLTDTTEEEDVHINDWLVEQKLAEHGKMGDKVEMSNIMLYVEENLIFSPEKCYESETSVTTEQSSNESTKESLNGPLVLPQSTLEDTYFKTAQEPTVSEIHQNFPSIAEESVQAQVSPNNLVSVSNTDTLTNNCTNPFLQDVLAHNEVDLNSKRIMELWNENLRLQMEITTTFKTLFMRILNTTVKSESDNLIKDESVNTSNIFLHSNDNTLSTNSANINIASTCQDTPPSNANTWNENFNLNIYSDSCQNTNTIQNGNSSVPNKATTNVRIPPGYENYIKFKFNTEYAENHINIEPTTTTNNYSSNNERAKKETNPFKRNLANKSKISNSTEDNNRNDSICLSTILHENQKLIADYDSVIQRFLEKSNFNAKPATQENAENPYTHTLCNGSEHYFNSTANGTNNIKNESFVTNAKSRPTDYTWDIRVDDITNRMSRIVIDNQDMQHAAKNAQNIEHRTGQYLHSFHNPGQQECVVQGERYLASESRLLPLSETQTVKKPASNYDLNNYRFSTKTPANNLGSTSTITDNTNFYEGYFTRPSTSQTACVSSPLLQVHNKTDGFQELSNENGNKSAADMWTESLQNTAKLNDWNKMTFLPEKSEQTMMYPKNHLNHGMKSSNTRGVTESFNIDNTAIQSSSSKGNQLQNTVLRITEYPIYFQVIDLTTGPVHILYYQGEGWLLTDEFFKRFTKFESSAYALIFVYKHNIRADYKQIDRSNGLIKFINIGSILSPTTYERIYNKSNVHLTQLKSAIKILEQLQIISKEDTQDAVASDTVARDIWLIENAYKHLKYRIENIQQL